MTTSRQVPDVVLNYIELFKQLSAIALATDKSSALRTRMDHTLDLFYSVIMSIADGDTPANLNRVPVLLKNFASQKKDDNLQNLINQVSQDIKNNLSSLKTVLEQDEHAATILHKEFLAERDLYESESAGAAIYRKEHNIPDENKDEAGKTQANKDEAGKTQANKDEGGKTLNTQTNTVEDNKTKTTKLQTSHKSGTYDALVAREYQLSGELSYDRRDWEDAIRKFKVAIPLLNEAYHKDQLNDIYHKLIESYCDLAWHLFKKDPQKALQLINEALLITNKSSLTLNIKHRAPFVSMTIGENFLDDIYHLNKPGVHSNVYSQTEKLNYALAFFTLSGSMLEELKDNERVCQFINWQLAFMKVATKKLDTLNKLIVDGHLESVVDIIEYTNSSIEKLNRLPINDPSLLRAICKNYLEWSQLLSSLRLVDDSWLTVAENCASKSLAILQKLKNIYQDKKPVDETNIDLCNKQIAETITQLKIVGQQKNRLNSAELLNSSHNKTHQKNVHRIIVDLSSLHLGDQAVQPILFKIIHSNLTIWGIDLDQNQLGDQAATAIAKLLPLNKSIKWLSLNHNLIGDEGASQLAANQHITILSLSDNKISEKGAQTLFRNNSIDVLQLTDNLMSKEQLQKYIHTHQSIRLIEQQFEFFEGRKFTYIVFKNNTHRQYLNLTELDALREYIKTYPGKFKKLSLANEENAGDKTAIFLGQITAIEALDLSGTSVGMKGIVALCNQANLKKLILNGLSIPLSQESVKALAKNKTLTHLSLTDNDLHDHDLMQFKGNKTLKKLDLSGNRYISSNAINILISNTRLQSFSISNVNLDFAAAYVLGNSATLRKLNLVHSGIDLEKCVFLISNRKLEKLNLSNNTIELAAISEILKLNHLRKLNLSYTPDDFEDLDPNFYHDSGNKIAELCAQNNTITELNLEGLSIGDEGAKKLAQNTTLLTLDLSNNQITSEGAKEFLKNDNLISICFGNNAIDNATLSAIADKLKSNKERHEQKKWVQFLKLMQNARSTEEKTSTQKKEMPANQSKKM